jgi:ribose 5-phosphate isomerase B
MDESKIRALVRRVLEEVDNSRSAPSAGPNGSESDVSDPLSLVTEADVEAVPPGGQLQIAPRAIVTPLARDAAKERRVTLVSVQPKEPTPEGRDRRETPLRVAMGADHGGYALKETLRRYLQDQGYDVRDCGTHGTQSVDYPDLAFQVARLVSEGVCDRGIMIDGAGIGSCMAANKVTGVRASLCYDVSSARNAREHNNANVLTLGGQLIGEALAKQIVDTWLETPFAGGRHARRVEKIMAVEKQWT